MILGVRWHPGVRWRDRVSNAIRGASNHVSTSSVWSPPCQIQAPERRPEQPGNFLHPPKQLGSGRRFLNDCVVYYMAKSAPTGIANYINCFCRPITGPEIQSKYNST